MQTGPKIAFYPQEHFKTVHDALILQGQEQSVKSNSFRDNEMLQSHCYLPNTLETLKPRNQTMHISLTKKPKKMNFWGEMKKVKLVKKAVKNLIASSKFLFFHTLKKMHFRIIGDPVKEVCEKENEFNLNIEVL